MSEKSAVVFIGSNSQEVRFLSVLKRYTPDYVLDSDWSKAVETKNRRSPASQNTTWANASKILKIFPIAAPHGTIFRHNH
jgi:hypothetical protein